MKQEEIDALKKGYEATIKELQEVNSLQREVIVGQEKLIERLEREKQASILKDRTIEHERIIRKFDELLPVLLKKFRELDIDDIDIKIINHRAAGKMVKLLVTDYLKIDKLNKRQQKLLAIIGIEGGGTTENWRDLKSWLYNNYLIKQA